MFNKIYKEIDFLLTQVIRNKQLIDHVAQMCADFMTKESKGEWSQQDHLQALEALHLGLQKRYEQFNK